MVLEHRLGGELRRWKKTMGGRESDGAGTTSRARVQAMNENHRR